MQIAGDSGSFERWEHRGIGVDQSAARRRFSVLHVFCCEMKPHAFVKQPSMEVECGDPLSISGAQTGNLADRASRLPLGSYCHISQ